MDSQAVEHDLKDSADGERKGCMLHAITLKDFKSYSKAYCGPLDKFACIVGANGAGKSVLGDAIAFVLRGTKGLDKRQITGLLNQKLSKQVDSPSAEVCLTFASEADPAQIFQVARRLKDNKSKPLLFDDSTMTWEPVSEAQFKQMLQQHGIMQDSIDRFIVRQQSQAVKVNDPMRLCQEFENLIGTADYASTIAEKAREASKHATACQSLEEAVEKLESRREALAPEVSKWQAYEGKLRRFHERKSDFLTSYIASLQASLDTIQGQEKHQLQAMKDAKAASDQAAMEMEQALAAVKEHTVAMENHRQEIAGDSGEVRKLKLQQTRLDVRLQKLQDAAQAAAASSKRNADRLNKLQHEHQSAVEAAAESQERLSLAMESMQQQEDVLAAYQKDPAFQQLSQVEAQAKKDGAAHAQAVASLTGLDVAIAASRAKVADLEAGLALEEDVIASHLNERTEKEKLCKSQCDEERGLQHECALMETSIQTEKERLLQIQVECQAVKDQLREGEGMQGLSSTAVDTAVQALHGMSRNGQLSGVFFGRLQNIAHVTQERAMPAVNAVLKEQCNPATTFLVTTRETAKRVVDHFSSNCVGVATCMITSEIRDTARAASSGNSDVQLEPLDQFIGVNDAACECQTAVSNLFGKWSLAATREDAVRVIQSLRGSRSAACNIVTLEGELFKADGEIVSGNSADRFSKSRYLLNLHDVGVGGQHVSTADVSQAKSTLHQMKERLKELHGQEKALCSHVADLEARLRELRRKHRDICNEIQNLQKALDPTSYRVKLDGLREAMNSIKDRHDEQVKHLQELLSKREARQARIESLHSIMQRSATAYEHACLAVDGGKQYIKAQIELDFLNCQVDQARAEHAANQQKLQKIGRQLRALQAVMADDKPKHVEEVRKLVAQIQKGEDSLSSLATNISNLHKAHKQAKGRLKAAEKELKQKTGQHSMAAKTTEELQVNFEANRHKMQRLSNELREAHASLAALPTGVAGSAAISDEHQLQGSAQASHSSHHAVGTSSRRADRKRQLIMSDSENEEEEEEEEAEDRTCEVPAKHKNRATHNRSGANHADQHAEEDLESSWEEQKPRSDDSESDGATAQQSSGRAAKSRRPVTAKHTAASDRRYSQKQLEQIRGELEYEEEFLQDLRKRVNPEATKFMAEVLSSLETTQQNLQAAQESLCRIEDEKEALETERYERFAAAVKKVNSHLSTIFKQLSGQQGDAYCSHPEDRLLLFAEGVDFHVRPDNRCWRPFALLSGGQQALATLALFFALQASFPSPFYFFDEIDCALDTSNAARVANYILSQPMGQYIVVSHKPQVYEKCSCLVGVYTACGTSAALTFHTHKQEEQYPTVIDNPLF